jgi:outer membrane protein assembly factor BamB
MKNISNISKTRIATIILAILLVSSIYVVFANAQVDKSQIDIKTNANSQKLNPATGQPYGDLSQYEWKSAGADGANTRSSNGPAPDNPSLLWSVSQASTSPATAFNGLVFTRNSATTYAYNATTGAYAKGWPVSSTGTPSGSVGSGSSNGLFNTAAACKINDQVGGWLSTTGPNFFNISNGVAFPKGTLAGAGWTAIGTGVIGRYWGCMYSPEDQCWIATTVSSSNGRCLLICIDATDPLNTGSFVRWQIDVDVSCEALCFGGGNAYFGGTGEGIIYAVNMQSGELVWTAYKPGNCGYSATFYDGILYQSASSTQITAFDGSTGATLFSFDILGARAFYVFGMSAMYGRIFAHSIEIPQGWIGGFDAKTLTQQWKYPAVYNIAYFVGAVADRKFIISTSDIDAGQPVTGYPQFSSTGPKMTAVDAFTGKLVWSRDISSSPIVVCVAYGNIYTQEGSTLKCYSDLGNAQTATTQSSWPQFHGPVDANGTSTGAVTGNYPININKASWNFEANRGVSGSVVAAAGKVFFGSWSGTLYCLDAARGTQIWSNQYNTRILSTPTYNNGTLYTGCDDGYAYALNADTGAQIWKANAGGRDKMAIQTTAWQAKCSPVIWNNTYYICGASDGQLYCLNATDGSTIWINQVSTYAVGIAGSPGVYYDSHVNSTRIYLMTNARLWQIDLNGTVVNNISLGTSLASCSTPVIVPISGFGDVLFVTYGAGSGTIGIRNATTLASIATFTLSFGSSGTTPMTQTVTYVGSQACIFPNRTNLGTANSPGPANQSGGPNVFRINQTDTSQKIMYLPCIYVCEASDISCWALIWNQTNLGTGTTQSTRYIQNYTTAGQYVNATRVWDVWSGHQVFASHAVAINTANPNSPITYIGNSVFGFNAYNGSTGATVSTFSAQGQVFATACLYNDMIFIGSNDAHVYGFLSSAGTTTIYADSNKGETMALNEPTVIAGALSTSSYFESPYDSNNNATFDHVEVPYANVTLVWINEDGTSSQSVTQTDIQGKFNFTYTPTVAGAAKWLVFFDGSQASTGVTLSQAYSTYKTMNVIGGQPSTSPTETPTATEVPPILPMEYIYAIVGIIVALVVIIAIVMALRKRKK